jgi:hypothetical protein
MFLEKDYKPPALPNPPPMAMYGPPPMLIKDDSPSTNYLLWAGIIVGGFFLLLFLIGVLGALIYFFSR